MPGSVCGLCLPGQDHFFLTLCFNYRSFVVILAVYCYHSLALLSGPSWPFHISVWLWFVLVGSLRDCLTLSCFPSDWGVSGCSFSESLIATSLEVPLSSQRLSFPVVLMPLSREERSGVWGNVPQLGVDGCFLMDSSGLRSLTEGPQG